MMGIYDKLTSGKRFLAILAVLIAYCILVMTTISKFNLVFSGKETGPLLNEENPTEIFVPEVPEELHGLDRDTARVKVNEFINDNISMKKDIICIVHVHVYICVYIYI